MQAELATLCDLDDSIVVTTTSLRTQLTCTDCCLYMKHVLFKTGSMVETDVVHAKAYTNSSKGWRAVLHLFWLINGLCSHSASEKGRDTLGRVSAPPGRGPPVRVVGDRMAREAGIGSGA